MADFLGPLPIVQTLMALAGDEPYRVYTVRREIPDRIAVANNLETVDGLNSFQFASYAQFMRAASGCRLVGLAAAVPPCASNEISETAYREAHPNPVLLGLLNVRYIISAFDLADPSLNPVASADTYRLYENTAVLPRAFVIGRAERVEGDVLARLATINPRSVALLDSNQAVDAALPDNRFFAPATISRYTPNEIRIEADLPGNGLLVLGDPWTPGWMADVDGQSAPVLRVDGVLRGVILSAGSHIVTFYFRPLALIVGLAVTALTLLICVVMVISDRLKRKNLS